METKEKAKNEKTTNLNLLMSQGIKACRSGCSDQKGGIVKVTRDSFESEKEFHTIQEQHNAHHALYYFSMITDSMIRGRSTGNDCEKIRRIIEHMMNLREYVSDNRIQLKNTIAALLKELRKFCPTQRKQFAGFVHRNWTLLYSFAEAYGYQDRCFSKV